MIDLEREAFKVALAGPGRPRAPGRAGRGGRGPPRRPAAPRRDSVAIAVVTDRHGVVDRGRADAGRGRRPVTLARAGGRRRAAPVDDRVAHGAARAAPTTRSPRSRSSPTRASSAWCCSPSAARCSTPPRTTGWAFLTPALLVAIGLSIVLALVLARALTRPLGQLVAATRRVARERGTAPSVEPRGPAEVRELAEAFNAMSLRVRELIDRQSQFASDVSHQLRTPLTTLGVAVERTRDARHRGRHPRCRGEPGRGAGRGHPPQPARGGTARADAGAARGRGAGAGRRRGDRARPRRDVAGARARARRRPHGARRRPAADALAVPGAVDQILDNLLDNAVEVAPIGSEIAIEVAGVRIAS